MKMNLLPCAILPVFLFACDSKPKEANNKEESVEQIDKPKAEVSPSEASDEVTEESNPETPVAGAVIGAVAGEIIGHQSGRALEGAAIGAAAGGVIGQQAQSGALVGGTLGAPTQPDEEEEEK